MTTDQGDSIPQEKGKASEDAMPLPRNSDISALEDGANINRDETMLGREAQDEGVARREDANDVVERNGEHQGLDEVDSGRESDTRLPTTEIEDVSEAMAKKDEPQVPQTSGDKCDAHDPNITTALSHTEPQRLARLPQMEAQLVVEETDTNQGSNEDSISYDREQTTFSHRAAVRERCRQEMSNLIDQHASWIASKAPKVEEPSNALPDCEYTSAKAAPQATIDGEEQKASTEEADQLNRSTHAVESSTYCKLRTTGHDHLGDFYFDLTRPSCSIEDAGQCEPGTTTTTPIRSECPTTQSTPGAIAVSGPGDSVVCPDGEVSPMEDDHTNTFHDLDPTERTSGSNGFLSLSVGTLELPEEVLLEATLVEETPRRTSFLNESLQRMLSAPLAQAIPIKNHHCPLDCSCLLERPKLCFCLCLWLVILVLALSIGLGLGLSEDKGAVKPSLQQIRKRGVLRCGLGSFSPGLHFLNEQGERSGFDVALCQAIAAAVFGDPAKVEFKVYLWKTRFLGLAKGEVDVLAAGTTHTMEREVFQPQAKTGFSFSSPYYYAGLQIAGDPHFVGCTENGMKNTEECALLRVCTLSGSSHEAVLSELLPGRQLVVVDSFDEMVEAFKDRKCLVLGHEAHQLEESSVRDKGYRGSYVIGPSVWSREPLALVSQQDDPEWSFFVDLVLHGLLTAEEYNITKLTAHLFPQTEAFGKDYKDMFRDSIAAVGNYAELYSQYLEPIIPRKDIDQLNDNPRSSSGLLFSHPFGSTETVGNAESGYVDQVWQSGKVRCGIIPSRPGFAEVPRGGFSYEGIEIDLCRALSAALFDGFSNQIEIVPVDNEDQGFAAVDKGFVDVFAGASWTLGSYTRVSETDSRFSFSTPYFYNYTAVGDREENLCLVTTAREHAWSSFVHWIVAGLVYAEENGITMENATEMPDISLFGSDHSRAFQDAVLSVGNYGQLYKTNLEELYPRRGRNLLNMGPWYGPQHYPIPGLLEGNA